MSKTSTEKPVLGEDLTKMLRSACKEYADAYKDTSRIMVGADYLSARLSEARQAAFKSRTREEHAVKEIDRVISLVNDDSIDEARGIVKEYMPDLIDTPVADEVIKVSWTQDIIVATEEEASEVE